MPNQALGVAVAVGLLAAATSARAQIIQVGPPSFQYTNYPSVETIILDRLALGGQYEPTDLATLSHLTVLESIAMMADVQYDMPNSMLGASLEGQIRQLWDAAALFEENVSAAPMSAQGLVDVQPMYNRLQAASQSIESMMVGAAGFSGRAGGHLRDITRLTAATGTVMRALELDFPPPVTAPAEPRRTVETETLKPQVGLLANSIVKLIENVKASKYQNSGWGAVRQDLEELLALVQSFQKTLSLQPSDKEMETSLTAVRRKMWRVEARIVRLGWPADLERLWRATRDRVNVLSDALGLPRVIDLGRQGQAGEPTAPAPAAKPTATIYRGPR
jgi:hypothetical protein